MKNYTMTNMKIIMCPSTICKLIQVIIFACKLNYITPIEHNEQLKLKKVLFYFFSFGIIILIIN